MNIYLCPSCKQTIKTKALNRSLVKHGFMDVTYTCPACGIRLRMTRAVYFLTLVFLAFCCVNLFSTYEVALYAMLPLLALFALFRSGHGFQIEASEN
ncbi:hypothetical protein [Sedimenticola selenatireducens]|uniref:Cxxc_20_cxxc protein n=1 Tax=Sedimenticola selenatireducens TaxID=191960 RepID=A0A557SHI4_9GAMM|nr:hypothetical protein [Sedimenticola selenatireducens]TVO76876.1 hypothetical protein FHP88_05470 [Sedimenticola selenatireducens]TVT64319.1 MAG: hypothetical protein FHK78_08715 [Sedimenticola selenatireducens]